jgi:hypothetical protein
VTRTRKTGEEIQVSFEFKICRGPKEKEREREKKTVSPSADVQHSKGIYMESLDADYILHFSLSYTCTYVGLSIMCKICEIRDPNLAHSSSTSFEFILVQSQSTIKMEGGRVKKEPKKSYNAFSESTFPPRY